jgi:hypothetical protein
MYWPVLASYLRPLLLMETVSSTGSTGCWVLPINFNIRNRVDPSALRSIKPASNLPTITEPVTINGYSQGTISTPTDTSDDATPNTLAKGTNAKLLIELSGSGVGSTANVGLKAEAPNVVIKGLVINSFSDSGVDIITPTATSDKVEGNFIGTDASGTQPLANGWYGVVASSGPSNNLIGGNTPAARNLISGNGGFGVEIADYRTTSTTSNNRISGNLIGTDKSSAEDLNNGEGGVFIVGALDNTVGGSKPRASNTIAFNRGYGVAVFSTTWVASPRDNILHNLIFYNWGIGISLNSDNRIPNDPGDTDSGPNSLQNYPVLQSAITSSGVTTIKGTLNTKPNSQYTVQFFSNPVGFGGQGMKFIGEQQLTTDSDGNDSFSYIPRRAVPAGLAASGYNNRNSHE